MDRSCNTQEPRTRTEIPASQRPPCPSSIASVSAKASASLPQPVKTSTELLSSAISYLANPERFRKMLDEAILIAQQEWNYSSSETRARMSREMSCRCRDKVPYPWQLDVAEATLLGLDVAIIAGTGAGKTLPFVLPLFADPTGKSKVIIISTLNELERDQAIRFNKMGLSATAVNGENWSEVKQKVSSNEFRVIITSPEMILKHEGFSRLVRDPSWMKDYLSTIVDEAHCVEYWGKDFRKSFSEIERIRSFMGNSKPFVIASATLPPPVLEDTLTRLQFRRENMFLVNLGNNRANITPIVATMKGGEKDLEALDWTIDEALQGGGLIRTVVYVKTRDLAAKVYEHLLDMLPPEYHEQLDFIHGRRKKRAKLRVMRRYRDGEIKILIATEVAGMGMDIPDIRRVVQFMVPGSLSEWTQHSGRAGRDGKPAIAVMLVEPSVHQRIRKRKSKAVKGKGKAARKQEVVAIKQEENDAPVLLGQKRRSQGEDEEAQAPHANLDDQPFDADRMVDDQDDDQLDEDVTVLPASHAQEVQDIGGVAVDEEEEFEFRKKIEEPVRQWINTQDCRRDVTDAYYQNPPREAPLDHAPIALSETSSSVPHYIDDKFPCCDNCVCRLGSSSDVPLLESHLEILRLKHRIETRPLRTCDSMPSESTLDSDLRRREKNRIETVISALRSWRHQYWLQNCQLCSWSEASLLSDKTMKILATGGHIRTTEDLKKSVPDWKFARVVGQEVLDVVQITDEAWLEDYGTQQTKKRKKSGEKHKQDLEDWNDVRWARNQERLEAEGKIPRQASTGSVWLEYTGAGDKENYKRIDKPAPSSREPLTSLQHLSTPPAGSPTAFPTQFQDVNGHWWYLALDGQYYRTLLPETTPTTSSTPIASSSAVTLDTPASMSASYTKITWVGGEKKKRARK